MTGCILKPSSWKASDGKLALKIVVKKGKAAKARNKLKRPPGAFFMFMEGFRMEFKEKNPGNKNVATVAKAAGERWRSLSDFEKAPYIAKFEKLNAEYVKKSNARIVKKFKKMFPYYSWGEKDAEVESDESELSESDDEDGSRSEEEDDDWRWKWGFETGGLVGYGV